MGRDVADGGGRSPGCRRSQRIGGNSDLVHPLKRSGQSSLEGDGVPIGLGAGGNTGPGRGIPKRAAASATTTAATANGPVDSAKGNAVGNAGYSGIAFRQHGPASLEGDLEEESIDNRNLDVRDVEVCGDRGMLFALDRGEQFFRAGRDDRSEE